MAEKKHADLTKDASLKTEVKQATKEAEHDAKTGDVATIKQEDMPTGTRARVVAESSSASATGCSSRSRRRPRPCLRVSSSEGRRRCGGEPACTGAPST